MGHGEGSSQGSGTSYLRQRLADSAKQLSDKVDALSESVDRRLLTPLTCSQAEEEEERAIMNLNLSAGELCLDGGVLSFDAPGDERPGWASTSSRASLAFDRAEECFEEAFNCTWREAYALVHQRMIPDWLKGNDWIHHGYRPVQQSFYRCFHSLLYLHNETGNCYTHIVGFFVFFAILLSDWASTSAALSSRPWLDQAIFVGYYSLCMVSMFFSALFHTLCCHSQWGFHIFSRLDYLGVACMIMGSFFPSLYLTWYCHPYWLAFYIGGMFISGLGCAAVCLMPVFGEPKYRALRAGVFIGLGAFGMVPIVHYVVVKGAVLGGYVYLGHAFIAALVYLTAATLYITGIPERFSPGTFDIWGHSHQWMHILVVVAALLHYYNSMLPALRFRATHSCSLESF